MPTEGELWARDALAVLRHRSFGPGAWRDFLRASYARARATRRSRPDLARQAQAWNAIGAVASVAVPAALRRAGAPTPSTRTQLMWWTAVALMLDWHLGMVESRTGERRRLAAADALTLARLWLTPFAAAAPPARGWSLAVLAVGGATDLADGPLARRRGATRIGPFLDRTADIAFVSAAAVAAHGAGWLGRPAGAVLAARHAGAVGVTALHYFGRGGPPPDGSLAQARLAGPFVFGGLGLVAGGRQRLGGAVVATASAAALAWALAGPRLRDAAASAERSTPAQGL